MPVRIKGKHVKVVKGGERIYSLERKMLTIFGCTAFANSSRRSSR